MARCARCASMAVCCGLLPTFAVCWGWHEKSAQHHDKSHSTRRPRHRAFYRQAAGQPQHPRLPLDGVRLVAAPLHQHQHQHCPTDNSALNVPAQHKPAQSPVIASLSRSTVRLRPCESWIGQRLTPSFGTDRVKRHPQACCRALTRTIGGSQSTARL